MALTITSKTTRQELADELVRIQSEYGQFRKDVAQAALDVKDSEGWCSDGFREAMDNLGLADLIPSTERIVTLKIRIDADEAGYDAEYMGDEEWADAAISSIRYKSAHELEGYEVSEVPQDK